LGVPQAGVSVVTTVVLLSAAGEVGPVKSNKFVS
jgi:hypothetical protein